MKRLFVTILVLAATYAFAQDSYTLVYKPIVDKTCTYAIDSQQKVTQEMGGQEMVNDLQSTSKITLTPQRIDDNGDFVCIGQYLEKSSSIKNFRMDTTLVEADQCGKRVELLISALGKTLAVTELDSFPRSGGMMRMAITDPKIAFKRILRELPEKPVRTGDTWVKVSHDTITVMGIKLTVTTEPEYTLVGAEEKSGYNCLKITFTGTIALEGQGSQMGNDFFLEGSGKAEGTVYFAPAEGLLVYEEVQTDQETTIAITGQANMTIPQTTWTHAKISLVP